MKDNKLIITIVIQARMSSSGFDGQVLLPILGEPLLYRIIERINQSKYDVNIVVVTSTEQKDYEIAKFCHDKNITFYRVDLKNLLDRNYQVALLTGAKILIQIPSNSPLIDPNIIDKVIDFYLGNLNKYDFVSNVHPATYPDGNEVELMSFDSLEKAWKDANRPFEFEYTRPYFWKNPRKFRSGNVTWETGLDYSNSHCFTIGSEADYKFIIRVYEALYPINPRFALKDILNLISSQPLIYKINTKFSGANLYRYFLNRLKTINAGQAKKSGLINSKF